MAEKLVYTRWLFINPEIYALQLSGKSSAPTPLAPQPHSMYEEPEPEGLSPVMKINCSWPVNFELPEYSTDKVSQFLVILLFNRPESNLGILNHEICFTDYAFQL